MSSLPRKVVVDLTPVLPGGENGGAKVFVLELLAELAALAPATAFVLLTRQDSHDELAFLDRANMSRLMALGSSREPPTRARERLIGALRPRVPAAVRRVVRSLVRRVDGALTAGPAHALVGSMDADLLFCPFTAPTFHHPRVPTVCTLYDLQYRTYPSFFSEAEVAERDRTFREACRRATRLAAISDYTRQSAVAHGGLASDRIRTIPLRMAQRIASAGDGDVLRRLGVEKGRYYLYPANFWRHKNHEMLLAAFGIAARNGLPGDVKLVCTGAPGGRMAWLKEAARAMGLGPRVVMPGYVPDRDLAGLLGDAVGVVFPSLYEGFGLPVLEAMASGVPVACSNLTALPEVAGDAALLFDPRVPAQISHAMLRLEAEPALRASLARAGRQRAEAFADSGRMAREYLDLFAEALTAGPGTSEVTGIYTDGWAGGKLHVRVAPSTVAQRLEIEFALPEWAPPAKLLVRASRLGRPVGAALHLARGDHRHWAIPLDARGGDYELDIGPTFVPRRCGMGDDGRELSVMLRECTIVRGDGKAERLFPVEPAP